MAGNHGRRGDPGGLGRLRRRPIWAGHDGDGDRRGCRRAVERGGGRGEYRLSWCDPTPKVAERVAVPLLTATGAPTFVVPSRNCTVPAAADGATVAVMVTGVPSTTCGPARWPG